MENIKHKLNGEMIHSQKIEFWLKYVDFELTCSTMYFGRTMTVTECSHFLVRGEAYVGDFITQNRTNPLNQDKERQTSS